MRKEKEFNEKLRINYALFHDNIDADRVSMFLFQTENLSYRVFRSIKQKRLSTEKSDALLQHVFSGCHSEKFIQDFCEALRLADQGFLAELIQ